MLVVAAIGRHSSNLSRVACCKTVRSLLVCRISQSCVNLPLTSLYHPPLRQYTAAVGMTSRRSGRVAAQQTAKPTVSYKEVNSDDDSSKRRASNNDDGTSTTKRRRGAASAASAAAAKPTQVSNGKKRKKAAVAEEEDDDDVIVMDDGEEDEAEAAAPNEEEEEESEDTTKRSKRKKVAPAATKGRKSAKQKVSKKIAAVEEETAEEEEQEDEEEGEEQTKPAKPAKGKRAAAKGKKGKKAAAGDVADPIAVDDDGDGEDEDKPKKKPAKPKKEKQPKLLPHIRTVSTALPESKKLLGAHIGTSGGVHFGPHNAAVLGARCFAMDTRSKRRWASPPYSTTVIESFHSHMQHYGYSGSVVLPHGSYLTNLGCLSDELWLKSKACIREELERCQQLGVTKYVFHPGRASTSGDEREEEIRQEKEKKKLAREKAREKAKEKKMRLKAGEEVSEDEEEEDSASSQPTVDPSEYLFCDTTPTAVRSFITAQPAVRVRSLGRLITGLNELLAPAASAKWKDVHILIETMAGVGNQLCSRFEELRYVIDALNDPSHIGVCIDTCHVFAADSRYDVRDRAGYERVMGEVGDIIGWQYVKGMHMNDSKCGLGSHRDRHENIGDGEIGIDLFTCIMNDPRWDNIPMVLETPCKTESKEAAKRKKKAMAAGAPVEEEEGEDEEDEGDDDEEEEGGKKGKGKGKAKGAAVKEKEDWVKSYSEEIDMVYGLEKRDQKQMKEEKNGKNDEKEGKAGKNGTEGKREETVAVKSEKKEHDNDEGDGEDEEKDPIKEEVVVTVEESGVVTVVKVEEVPVKAEKKKKPAAKRGKRGKAKAAQEEDEAEDGEDE